MIELKGIILYFLFIFVCTFFFVETKESVKTYQSSEVEKMAEEIYMNEKIQYIEESIDTIANEIKEIENVPNKSN